MPKANSKDPKEAPASFEAALAELESIVQAMEQGTAPLEASLASYERGTVLLRYCQEALAGAEQKIRILEGQTLRELDAPQEVPLGDIAPAGEE
jgi:exodeoxyribonuclease VII small subunit